MALTLAPDPIRPIKELSASTLDDWNIVAESFYTGLVIDSEIRKQFDASLAHCQIDDLNVNWIKAPVSFVDRWRSKRSWVPDGTALLHLQAAGVMVSDQFGHEVVVRQGEGALCDPNSPYSLDFKTPYQIVVLELPLSRVAIRRPDFDIGESGGLPVDSRYTRLLLSFLKGVWEQVEDLGDDPDWREAVSRISLDLATSAIAGAAPSRFIGSHARLRKSVIEHIATNLTDPDLRTSSIAASVGVSPRTVQTVFERMLTTASAFILNERLQRAASRLRDRPEKESITSVAYDCGFSDSAYFSRCFRKRFGVPPRQYGVR